MPILKTISPKVPGSLEDIAAPHKIWKKKSGICLQEYTSSPPSRFNGIHTQIIQCLSMIVCLTHSFPDAPFLYSLKASENCNFLMFSRGTKRVHWERTR